jgi:hypothetical protein
MVALTLIGGISVLLMTRQARVSTTPAASAT